MQEPSILFYSILIIVCLFLVVAGAYLLVRYKSLFRQTVKDEWLRRNLAVWLIIFCLSGALLPISGNFFYLLYKYGWSGVIFGHLISTTTSTLITYNAAYYVIENKRFRNLSFIKHNLLIVLVVTITTLLVTVPFAYMVYDKSMRAYIKFSYVSAIYIGATTGLIYALARYLDIERKRKFDEKELELSRMRQLKTQAELDALHSKINPHFLYNSLNSIADLSITDGKKARKMTIALADLFRYSINYSENNYSTVQEELSMAEVYLQIEKIRFEDQLNYSVQCDPEAAHYLMPRFLLQPIVENAVKHGLKVTGKMTNIELSVLLKPEGLDIRIADNGPDFPEEINPGYGVKSVFDKLDLLFPGNYSVQFLNKPEKQIVIQINKLIKHEPAV